HIAHVELIAQHRGGYRERLAVQVVDHRGHKGEGDHQPTARGRRLQTPPILYGLLMAVVDRIIGRYLEETRAWSRRGNVGELVARSADRWIGVHTLHDHAQVVRVPAIVHHVDIAVVADLARGDDLRAAGPLRLDAILRLHAEVFVVGGGLGNCGLA